MFPSGEDLTETELYELVDRLERRTRDYTDLPSGHPNEISAFNAKLRRMQEYCNLMYSLHGVVFVGHLVHPHLGPRTVLPQAKEFNVGRDLKALFGESPFRANTIAISNLVTQIDEYRRGKTSVAPSLFPSDVATVPSPFPDPNLSEEWKFAKFKKELLPIWSETFSPQWFEKRTSSVKIRIGLF